MKKKSILEQALLQVETLEEAVKQNAKGILASTMKQELNDLLKEQEEEDELPVDDENDQSDEMDSDDENLDLSNDDESMVDDSPEGLEGIDGMDGIDDLENNDDLETDDDFEDEDVLDMTGASDEEVIKVYKAMSPDDGIVVKKVDGNVELSVNDEDFIIKLDEQEEDSFKFEFGDEDVDNDELEDSEFSDDELEDSDDEFEIDEDTVYEIELDDESFEDETTDENDVDQSEFDEAARTIGYGVRKPRQKKMFKAGRTNNVPNLNEQVEVLKKQNNEYKKALVLFKEKLNEVAVFNANLAYATRLFTEHTTTKQEKLDILKRFDKVSTITESKNLYSQIKTEIDKKQPISESVSNKISSTPKTSSSKDLLSESKAYENSQFKRMKELMGKMNK